jgi:hypothetical protein
VEPEPAEDLEQQCEDAAVNGFPHGVSVRASTTRTNAVSAPLSEVELYFSVTKQVEVLSISPSNCRIR